MLGPGGFTSLPGSRAAVWDKALGINMKDYHQMSLLHKRKRVQEAYMNLRNGKSPVATTSHKSNPKNSMNESSTLKTSSISD